MTIHCLGIDVSKHSLKCALGQEIRDFDNTPEGFEALLEWSEGTPLMCTEATGRYHEALAKRAYAKGVPVAVVNPGQAKKYLGFVSPRAKTDKVDASALARMAEREGENLRPYKPVPELIAAARDIIVRRKTLVEARVSLRQVINMVGDPSGHLGAVLEQMNQSITQLERQLAKALRGYSGYEKLMTIPSIGPLCAAQLVCALERGEFVKPDSLVAFAGLDPKAFDSGQLRGRRALSHHGDAQLRAALYMAAMTGMRLPEWKDYYRSQREKGLAHTASVAILARKLCRVAWAVYRQEGPFISKRTVTP